MVEVEESIDKNNAEHNVAEYCGAFLLLKEVIFEKTWRKMHGLGIILSIFSGSFIKNVVNSKSEGFSLTE